MSTALPPGHPLFQFFHQAALAAVRDPHPQTIEEERDLLRHKLEVVKKELERFNDQATSSAVVMGVSGGRISMRVGDQSLNIQQPAMFTDAKPGMMIEVMIQGGVILKRIIGPQTAVGAILTVKKVHEDKGTYELTEGPVARVVLSSIDGVQTGHRVGLDPTGTTIIANYGKPKSSMAFTEETGIEWDDIGGQAEAKRALREAIEEPYIHAEAYKAFGKRPGKGILLYGPPGNGKTMLGKAAATALARLHGASGRTGGFIYVKGPEVLNMWQGESEAGVRRMFASARAHKEEHGYPAIIFVDEADALVCKRGVGRNEGAERTIVPQFLAEMDGLEDSGAFVMLATNRPQALDSAITRDGRVDRKVEVGAPTKEDFAEIVHRALLGKLIGEEATTEYLSQLAAEDVFGEKHVLFNLLSKTKKPFPVTLGNFASGAMAVGIVERATQRALRRHMVNDGLKGIASDDVMQSVEESALETKAGDPSSVLMPMAAAMGEDFAGVAPVLS